MSKRKSVDIRNEHILAGAVCIKIDYQKELVPFAQSGVASLEQADKNLRWGRGKDPSNTYRTMERKGFRFTEDHGCFAPVKRFTMKSGGANERGYQLSFWVKHGFMLAQSDSEAPSSNGDAALQLSHLCHRRWCCRLDHLVVEPRWRNAARNHCLGPVEVDLPGRGKTKTCGCSLQYHYCGKQDAAGLPCVCPWSPSPPEVPVDIGGIVTSTSGIKDLLVRTKFPFSYLFYVWEERTTAGRTDRELKKLQGPQLVDRLADKGLVSPDLRVSKKTKLVQPGQVKSACDPKVLVYEVYDSDDDDFMEQDKAKRNKM